MVGLSRLSASYSWAILISNIDRQMNNIQDLSLHCLSLSLARIDARGNNLYSRPTIEADFQVLVVALIQLQTCLFL